MPLLELEARTSAPIIYKWNEEKRDPYPDCYNEVGLVNWRFGNRWKNEILDSKEQTGFGVNGKVQSSPELSLILVKEKAPGTIFFVHGDIATNPSRSHMLPSYDDSDTVRESMLRRLKALPVVFGKRPQDGFNGQGDMMAPQYNLYRLPKPEKEVALKAIKKYVPTGKEDVASVKVGEKNSRKYTRIEEKRSYPKSKEPGEQIFGTYPPIRNYRKPVIFKYAPEYIPPIEDPQAHIAEQRRLFEIAIKPDYTGISPIKRLITQGGRRRLWW